MAAPNPPPPPPPPIAVSHPKCSRGQARQDRSTAHELDAQGLLHFYPTIPNEVLDARLNDKIEMLAPSRYLPPQGGHYVIGDSERVQVPGSLGSTRCANCFQRLEQDSECFRKQCPNACGYCDQRHDTTTPCPRAYNTERSWKRRNYRFRDGIPESLCLFPSKDQFDILKANGYITSHASYDLKRTPDFSPDWLGNQYFYRELSITSPLLQQQKQQQQQQRKLAIPKSRQKHAPRYAGQETTNSQAMLRIFESMQASQERMLQAIDAVSARGQMPPPPPPPPQPQPQPQPQPGHGRVVYNIERGSNVTFGRDPRAGAVADTPRPASISEWARDSPQHPDAQSETTRDTRSLRDRMTFPLESRITYDTQSNAGSSSTRPRYPASNKRECSPSAHQGSTTSARKHQRSDRFQSAIAEANATAPSQGNERRARFQSAIADATTTAPSQGNERRARFQSAVADATTTAPSHGNGRRGRLRGAVADAAAPPQKQDNATTQKTGQIGP